MTEETTIDLETCSRDEIRRAYNQLLHSDPRWGEPGYDEKSKELEAIVAAGVRRFANPEVPGCSDCERYSVFGGPNHRNSSYCESGKRPHCSCSWCF